MTVQATENLYNVLCKYINFRKIDSWMDQAQQLFDALNKIGAKRCISAVPQMDAINPIIFINFIDSDGINKWLSFHKNDLAVISVDCPE